MARHWIAKVWHVLACLTWMNHGWRVPTKKQVSERSVASSLPKTALSMLLTAQSSNHHHIRPASTSRGRGRRQALERLRGGSLISSASAALGPREAEPVTVVTSCGAGISASPVVSEALGASLDPVSMVDTPTPIALFNVVGASDSDISVAAAAADVLTVEVRFDDLVKRSPHGLGQMRPVLRRSKPNLLLVVVTDFDASEASEADVRAFVDRELDEIAKTLEVSASTWKAQCAFLPSRSAPDYDIALASLGEKLTTKASTLSFPAVDSLASVKEAAETWTSAPSDAAPAQVHAAYKASVCAKEALLQFRAGASELQAEAAQGLMVDFGGQATAVIDKALATFDMLAPDSTVAVTSTRKALSQQMHRMLYGSFRKQLQALQQNTIGDFAKRVENTQASADIEQRLQKDLSNAMKEFDMSARHLRPPGADWTYAYERAAVLELMKSVAKEHVQNHQMQGLYVSPKKRRIPVDFSAHWLSLNPFGRDGRFDADMFAAGDIYKKADKKSSGDRKGFNERLKDFQKRTKDKFKSWTAGNEER
mmetsp:Transcript_112220/g.177453  ORF Transcript_112220/g.177453 Transcript_112220/m.177453 type:complete len:538 (+) Transcript_112220:41-1654(+)